MIRLVEDMGSGRKAFYPIDNESVIIGRDPVCNIVLAGDAVSRQHARIHRETFDWFIDDLGSSNSVFVNNTKIEGSAKIQPGDMIMIGDHYLVLEEMPEDRTVLDDTVHMEEARKIRFPASVFTPDPRDGVMLETKIEDRTSLIKAAIEKAGQPTLIPAIEVIEGRDKGAIFALTLDEVLIGRSPECHIRLTDPSVSATHARFAFRRGSYQIIDLDSSNGLFVDDLQVRVHPLKSGDIIRLGSTKIRFEDGLETVKIMPQTATSASSSKAALQQKKSTEPEPQTSRIGMIIGIAAAALVVLLIVLYFIIFK